MDENCQSLRQVRLLYDRWRHHLSPPPQFRHGTGRKENILQSPALVVFAAIQGDRDFFEQYGTFCRPPP
ncbi:hypothetical protein TNCV_4499871 [Trichonephila clavipes]|nr:hypothetical protein TNCV_4499871 [Trichonephila clavipes]